ncbi:SusC/RagA family TonB-linked outer membrane protein [Puteibacter caeruleilacunae]|nr:SusC/RagA family TonB-linked outer membrane protein [Puteibacter caeruleilacunae]
MKKVLLTMICMCAVLWGFAQGKVVTGVVSDASTGESIPGANVVVKGTTQGTVTDFDGKYSLKVTEDNVTLVFSFVGYIEKEVAYTGQEKINVTLKAENLQVDEVVVTALGIKRDKKALGYSVSEVKGDDIAKTNDGNVLNSLKGKAAGVSIANSAGGATGSSAIVLRGYSTFGGDNGALIVVDGVPMQNASNTQGGSSSTVDFGSGISDLNQEDIESISILKGANAAALYGSRALNGVVMITTKKGKEGKMSVVVNNSLKISQAVHMTEMQNEFGQGHPGRFGSFLMDGDVPTLEFDGEKSWGPRMEGQMVRVDWRREQPMRAYTPQPDNYKDLLQTGVTYTSSVSMSGGNEKANYNFSALYEDLEDIIPTSEQQKYNATIRISNQLMKGIRMDNKMAFTYKKTYNRATLGSQRSSYYGLLIGPRSFYTEDIEDYKYGESGKTYGKTTLNDGHVITWSDSFGSSAGNPYWELYNNFNHDHQSRIVGFNKIDYELIKDLTFFHRVGWDYSTIDYTRFRDINSRYYGKEGSLVNQKTNRLEVNADFLATYKKDFGELKAQFNVGGNHSYRYTSSATLNGSQLIEAGFASFVNAGQRDFTESVVESSVNSLYASAQLSYGNYLFLDITGRNDWTSTLAKDERSFFYPSVNLGFVVTDAFNIESSILDYAKIRTSYAEVGNDVAPYRIHTYYDYGTDGLGRPSASLSNQLGNSALKPERSKSYELGLDLRFLKNRIGLDLTYYDARIEDQIISAAPIAQSSGYTKRLVNAGEIKNEGIEASLFVTPIKSQDFEWTMTVNYAKNRNTVVDLADGIDFIEIGSARGVQILAKPDMTFGTFWGLDFKRDDKGQVIVDANGIPEKASEKTELGNIQRDFTGSIHNNIRFKNFTFNALIDASFGGDIFCLPKVELNRNGTTKQSLDGRDGWLEAIAQGTAPGAKGSNVNGLDYWVGNSVYEDGTANAGSNAMYMNPYEYWNQMRGKRIITPYLEDGTYVQLREISLSYDLPKSLFANNFLNGVSVGFVGRNLAMLYKKTDFFNPEQYRNNTSVSSAGSVSGTWPSQRSFTFNVKVKF